MPIDPRRYAMTPEGRNADRLADLERRVSGLERASLSGVAKAITVLSTPTTTTVPNTTQVAVAFAAPAVDVGGWWNAAQPSRLTVNRRGVYLASSSVSIFPSAAGDRQAIVIAQHNVGAELRGFHVPAPVNEFQSAPGGFFILEEGDYIELHCYQDSGGPLALDDADLALAWLGVGAS